MQEINWTGIDPNMTFTQDHIIRATDIIGDVCNSYITINANAVIMVFFMYLFATNVIKPAVYVWLHPEGIGAGQIHPDIRRQIATFIEWIQFIAEGVGLMAAMLLVYFVYIQGGFSIKHYIILGLIVIVFLINLIAGIIFKMRNRGQKNAKVL